MAARKSLSSRSSMLAHVGYLDIRNVFEKDVKNVITSSDICVYHGKKLVKNGFKNKDEAIAYAGKRLV